MQTKYCVLSVIFLGVSIINAMDDNQLPGSPGSDANNKSLYAKMQALQATYKKQDALKTPNSTVAIPDESKKTSFREWQRIFAQNRMKTSKRAFTNLLSLATIKYPLH